LPPWLRPRCRCPEGDDHHDLTAKQVGRKRRQPLVPVVGIAMFDRDILAFDEASLFETPKNRRRQMRVVARPPWIDARLREVSKYPHKLSGATSPLPLTYRRSPAAGRATPGSVFD
jgi:hypothetical protein